MKAALIALTVLSRLLLAVLAIPALAGRAQTAAGRAQTAAGRAQTAAKVQPAPAADTYDLTWFTHDSGASPVTSADGVYSLVSTAGQPDAGIADRGGYTMQGGFWYGANPLYRVSLPVVIR